jgi:hypothetical protein
MRLKAACQAARVIVAGKGAPDVRALDEWKGKIMITRTILSAILGAMLLSAPALAATTETPVSTHGHPPYRGYGPNRSDWYRVPQIKPYEYSTIQQPGSSADIMADRCTRLQAQFDSAIKPHAQGTKFGQEKVWRTEGGELCQGGHDDMGVALLERALHGIGVEAQS